MNPRYAEVAERAAHRCEYCHAPEAVFNFPFEVEHVLPRTLDGTDDDANLALACRSCNLRKGTRTRAVDRQSGGEVALFNPRLDAWREHLRIDPDTAELVGITPVGRATVEQLRMNGASQLTARRVWLRLGLFS